MSAFAETTCKEKRERQKRKEGQAFNKPSSVSVTSVSASLVLTDKALNTHRRQCLTYTLKKKKIVSLKQLQTKRTLTDFCQLTPEPRHRQVSHHRHVQNTSAPAVELQSNL